MDMQQIESVTHGIETVKTAEKLPYVVAVKHTNQSKSWRSKINILNDPNTLTYHRDDKDSIKRVWQTMIRQFELDVKLERRFLDCIESKV